jgi:hypothetical protein
MGYDDVNTEGLRFEKQLPPGGTWSGEGDRDDFVLDEVHHWTEEQARRHSLRLTAERERTCRHLAERKLRPRLRWLVDHPRLLALVYRLAPSWRPTLRIYQSTTAD